MAVERRCVRESVDECSVVWRNSDLFEAFREGKIRSYGDIVAMSPEAIFGDHALLL